MTKDIRWKQRFSNFEKAFFLLKETSEIENLSVAERGGLIQFYEMAFELSWKLMKDYLVEEGWEVNSPREAIKQAFQARIITDGHTWMEALEDRNLTTHTYDENKAQEVAERIRNKYFCVINELHAFMKEKIGE